MLLVLIVGVSSKVFAEDSANDSPNWENNIAERGGKIALENLKEIMNQEGFDKELKEELLKPRPRLQIFVSASMPRQLLKSYANEASIHGGVLVFRGLPNGSIHALSELVMEIGQEAAMNIDDEAFAAYGIKNVPAIVLSSSKSIFEGVNSEENFDKVSGSITLKAALELFKDSGLMKKQAKEMLQ